MSLITIAIPFYNAENYLELAIKSVLNQTYTSWKLLLVNDGSTDASLEIANKYAQIDDRIEVFSDGMNKNLGFRLNQIPTLTNTPYLARMDADDLMHPQRIERQLSILQSNPLIDVLGSNAISIDANHQIQGIRLNYDENLVEMVKVKSFIHPTIMAKTEWFLNNPYNVEAVRIEDAELWYRTAENSCLMSTTEPLLFYREFGSNYYKKYFKSLSSHKNLLFQTKDFFWFKAYFKTFLMGSIYYLCSIINQEAFLIEKRSQKISVEYYNKMKSTIYNIIE